MFDLIFCVLEKKTSFVIFFVLLETTKKQTKKKQTNFRAFVRVFFPFSKYHPVLLFIVDRAIVIEL